MRYPILFPDDVRVGSKLWDRLDRQTWTVESLDRRMDGHGRRRFIAVVVSGRFRRSRLRFDDFTGFANRFRRLDD